MSRQHRKFGAGFEDQLPGNRKAWPHLHAQAETHCTETHAHPLLPARHLPQLPGVLRSEFQPQTITSSPPVTPGAPSGEGPAEGWPPTRLGLCWVRVPKGPRGVQGEFPSHFSVPAPHPLFGPARGLFDLRSDKEHREGRRLRAPRPAGPPPARTRGALGGTGGCLRLPR